MTIANKWLVVLIILLFTTPIVPQPTGEPTSLFNVFSQLVNDGCINVEGDVLPSRYSSEPDFKLWRNKSK